MSKTRTVKVGVTQDDITRGVKCRGNSCALQLALARALNDKSVIVGYAHGTAFLYGPSTHHHIINLPDSCLSFAVDFDAGTPVQPFSFEFQVPA